MPPPTIDYQPSPPRAAVRVRFFAWTMVVALVIVGTIAWTLNRHAMNSRGCFPSGWLAFGRPTILFNGWLTLGGFLGFIHLLLQTTPADALRIGARSSHTIIIGAMLAMISVSVLTEADRLTKDRNRYATDAALWVSGRSPYSTASRDFDHFWYAFEHRGFRGLAVRYASESFSRVEHDHLRTIYPPIAQFFFLGPTLLDPALARIWPRTTSLEHGVATGEVRSLREQVIGALVEWPWSDKSTLAFAAAVALASSLVLLRLLAIAGRSPWYAALFAWSPVLLVETADSGHVDILGVLFVLLCILFATKRQFVLAAIALAIAAGVKPHAAMLAPVLVMAAYRRGEVSRPLPVIGEGDGARAGVDVLSSAHSDPCPPPNPLPEYREWASRCAIAFILAMVVVYSPLIFSPANFRGWYETVQVYSVAWEANGSVYELITAPFRDGSGRSLEAAKVVARLLGGVGTFLTLYLCLRQRLPIADAAYWLFLIPVLLAPVVYPWYLLWGLAMVPLLRTTGGWTMLTWAATSVLSYQLLNEPQWRLPAAWLLAEYVPVYVALMFELLRLWRRAPGPTIDDRSPKVTQDFDPLRHGVEARATM